MPPYCCNSVATEISSFPFLCARKISRALLEGALIKPLSRTGYLCFEQAQELSLQKVPRNHRFGTSLSDFHFSLSFSRSHYLLSNGSWFPDLKFRVTGS